ncbi:MAG: DEAD/DEAH box helicase [Bacteriovoracaceae bacterium]|jgi:superfamily II DNA/RNA helicase|nr:DEAD/DEAH box helicase [Bacteriovoracaceae bacterium]
MEDAFKQLNLTHLNGFIKEMKFKAPTEVQKKIIPLILNGESILVSAPTGSGKTLTFAMPLVEMFKASEKQLNLDSSAPYAVILAPTRELAIQIHSIFKSLAHHGKIRSRLLIGGVKSKGTKESLRGPIDFLITVPGRFLSCLKKDEVKLSRLNHLVLDEADQFFDLGFKREMGDIWAQIDKETTQLSLFSATKPKDFEEKVLAIFEEAIVKSIDVGGKNIITKEIDTFNVMLHEGEKKEMLNALLKERARGTGIIFANRKEKVEEVFDNIKDQVGSRNIHILHGGMQTRERNKAFKSFVKDKGLLICTDVAARGIDMKEVGWVLNYDLPVWSVYYIHRCGRAGRGGTKGFVVNFVTPKESHLLDGINQAIKNQSALKLDLLKKRAGTQKSKSSKKNKKAPIAKKKARKNTPRYKRK